MPQGFDALVFKAQLEAHLGARQPLASLVSDRDDDNQMVCNLSISSRTDRDTFVQWLKARLGQRGGPTGVIATHLCSHAQGEPPDQWTNCKDDPLAEYAEVT